MHVESSRETVQLQAAYVTVVKGIAQEAEGAHESGFLIRSEPSLFIASLCPKHSPTCGTHKGHMCASMAEQSLNIQKQA